MIIDDRTFIVNPAVEGSLIYIIAKKWGKNGNKKKSVAWQTTGGSYTAELVERLQQVTSGSCVEIEVSVIVDVYDEIVGNEKVLIKRIRKMMK